MNEPFIQSADGFFVQPSYQQALAESGLDSLESVFAYEGGQNLTKPNLALWRHRIRFEFADGRGAYLKRYDRPPISVQLKGWIQHGRRALLSDYDKGPIEALAANNVLIPQTIAYGGRWAGWFERRSFIITLEIPNAHSLEQKLPDCFQSRPSRLQRQAKKQFIKMLADFLCRFHAAGYRHRDLYLSHVFFSGAQTLYLIDLHRSFKPRFFGTHYLVKDIAQLHYSCPAGLVGCTDRLRFYLAWAQTKKLSVLDKVFIRKVHAKALRMARHNRKHGRVVPFEESDAQEYRYD
jgi:hypothetical protein